MPELPTDPEKLAVFHRLNGGAVTLLSIYDVLSEILVFDLEKLYEPNSPEYKVAADTIEAVKYLIAKNQGNLARSARELLE